MVSYHPKNDKNQSRVNVDQAQSDIENKGLENKNILFTEIIKSRACTPIDSGLRSRRSFDLYICG